MSYTAGHLGDQPQSAIQAGRTRLQRAREERLLFGVCGGVARRFGVDVMIVRVLAVLASAVGNYAFLAYVIATVLIPKAPRMMDQWGVHARGRRPRRQIIAYIFLSIAANAVLVDRLPIPTGRTFAVALILAGLLLMQLRSRSVDKPRDSAWSSGERSESEGPAPRDSAWFGLTPPASTGEVNGGWISSTDLPPRWGLAGETANPHIWNPTESAESAGPAGSAQAATSVRSRRTSVWHTQFGNLALVVLVGVLAIGLWSNTSHFSPVRRAAIKDRLASGPVVVRSKADVVELNDEELGDGNFVVDLGGLNYPETPLNLRMGSGKLELVLPDNFHSLGQVSGESGGALSVLLDGESNPVPFTLPATFSQGKASSRIPSQVPTFRFSVTAENGLVCIRHKADSNGCNPSFPSTRK
jgi:phage shock protein C